MSIKVNDFKLNPFSSNLIVNIVSDGNSIKILNTSGAKVFEGEQYKAKCQIIKLLEELDNSTIQITTKVVFAVSAIGITSLMDNFRETLLGVASKYMTKNLKIEIKLAHLDYNN